MAALNFPDPNVTTTYTNPDTGITYEWSNNTWKAIRSAQTAPELFVDYDGDNMTGDLTFNTDKIVLGATFGTGTFAGNIEIGGDVSSPTAGGVEITGTGTVIANRIGNPNPVSYADCFVGRYNGVDTSEIKADGSATFTSTVTANIFESTGRNEINLADDGTGLAIQKAGATVGNLGVEGDVYKIGAIRNSTGSIEFTTKQSGVTTPKLTIANDGSATFAGGLNLGYDLASKVSVRPSALDESGIYLFEGDAGYTDSLVKAQYNQTLAGSDAKLWEGVGVVSGAFATTSTILPDGSATFAGQIDIDGTGSFADYGWRIAENGGMVNKTPSGATFTLDNSGSAIFESSVTSKYSGQGQVQTAASIVHGVMVKDTEGNINVTLDWDGSATFAGPINVNTTTGGTNVLRLESSGANSYGLMCKAGGAGPSNYYCDFRDQSNNSVFKVDGNGVASFSGTTTQIFSDGEVQFATGSINFQPSGSATFKGKLDVGNTYTGGEIAVFGKGTSGQTSYLGFHTAGTRYAYIGTADQLIPSASGSDFALRAQGNMLFASGGSTERMRIRSNGVLTWGNNPQFDVSALNAGIAFSTPGHPYIIVGGGPDTAGRYRMEFINGNGQVGTITTQGSSTSYNESSDYRLKENIVDIEDGITRVKQLQPRRFNFITDADTTVDGFIAHEAQTVVPEAVTGTRDEVDEEGNAIMQGIDKSKLVPLLTAALQEVIAKVETLEAEIAELKAG